LCQMLPLIPEDSCRHYSPPLPLSFYYFIMSKIDLEKIQTTI
jgi:hypothetical protein